MCGMRPIARPSFSLSGPAVCLSKPAKRGRVAQPPPSNAVDIFELCPGFEAKFRKWNIADSRNSATEPDLSAITFQSRPGDGSVRACLGGGEPAADTRQSPWSASSLGCPHVITLNCRCSWTSPISVRFWTSQLRRSRAPTRTSS
jgi:hypothetical protein